MISFGACLAVLISLLAAGCDSQPQPEPEPEIQASPRSRVRLQNGTVVTDRGTLLRGAYWSTDWSGELPARAQLAAIRKLGLNALHVYAEMFSGGYPAGTYVNQVDQLVEWCGELGLYCVLTIGNGTSNGTHSLPFARAFWEVYAPRYKDKPWVLYEIQNEPHAWSAPYPDSTVQMEQEVYDLIRQHAPDTHVLFFSYAVLADAGDVLRDVERLNVDWSNASVAWHGYNSTLTVGHVLGLKQAGISSISTELPVLDDDNDPRVNVARLRILESAGISWLVFLRADMVAEPRRFKVPIEATDLRWQPDYGQWPGR